MNVMNNKLGRVNRHDLERAIAFMDAASRRRAMNMVEKVHDERAQRETIVALMQGLGDKGTTIGERVVLFSLNALYRNWRFGSIEERTDAIREIAWVRAKLAARIVDDRVSVRSGSRKTSETDMESEGAASSVDSIAEAVGLAYKLCFGLLPPAEVLAATRNRCLDDDSFATWLAEIHATDESQRFRKASWTVLNPPPRDLAALISEDVIAKGIVLTYQLTVGRTPVLAEIDIWKGNFRNGLSFADFLRGMHSGEEALRYQKGNLANISDGKLVQMIYESILGYGVGPRELSVWVRELERGAVEREDILKSIFKKFAVSVADNAHAQAEELHNALVCSIACTGEQLTVARWNERAAELAEVVNIQGAEPETPHARFSILAKPGILITAIASLYRGGKYIEQFMDNITSQTRFRDYAELVIVDADSPENEAAVIARYLRDFPQIVYKRMNYRIGIYDAWNVGAQLARGKYLTNTNLDDIRRNDSLELQAATLENLPFVDVVYQDFFYTFDPKLSFEEIAKFGFKSNLPVVTTMNMMDFNSPHNAPMWRKSLHTELGYFDTTFKSAGDYDFWMRCLLAGKTFYKLNDAHVVYYQNPEGISTRPDTKGVQEGRRIFKAYARRLIPECAVMPTEEFLGLSSYMPERPAGERISRYAMAQSALRNVGMRSKYLPGRLGDEQ